MKAKHGLGAFTALVVFLPQSVSVSDALVANVTGTGTSPKIPAAPASGAKRSRRRLTKWPLSSEGIYT